MQNPKSQERRNDISNGHQSPEVGKTNCQLGCRVKVRQVEDDIGNEAWVLSRIEQDEYLLAVNLKWHDMYRTKFFHSARIDLLRLRSTDKVASESIEVRGVVIPLTHRSGPTFLLISCEGSSATRKADLKIEFPLLKSIMSKE